jgi:septal ring factor EnvC (AmiA/AmiB activator)
VVADRFRGDVFRGDTNLVGAGDRGLDGVLMNISNLSREQRQDLIDQLTATRRQVELDVRIAKKAIADMQAELDQREARLADIDHSLGHLK